MEPRTMYIEQKTDGIRPLDDKGLSIIKEVSFSKTGKTIYCDGKEYRRCNGVYGNYYCPQDGNEYWISGIKEDNRITPTAKSQKHERRRWMNGG